MRFWMVLIFFILGGCATSSERIPHYFHNEHNGLIPGQSTLVDTMQTLGAPQKIETTINGRNYYFAKATINFSGTDQEHINTIQIVNDPNYISPSGVKLNDAIDQARKKINHYKDGLKTIYDPRRGIFYWHDGAVIKKIVLVYSAYK